MDEVAYGSAFVFDFPLWVICDSSSEHDILATLVYTKTPNGNLALLLFTEDVLAEQYIAKSPHQQCRAIRIESLSYLNESLDRAEELGATHVAIDPGRKTFRLAKIAINFGRGARPENN